jgi:hypothetical protein
MVGEKEKTEESFFSLFLSFFPQQGISSLSEERKKPQARKRLHFKFAIFPLRKTKPRDPLFCFLLLLKAEGRKKGSLLLFFRQRLLRLSGDFKAVPSFPRREEERHAKWSFLQRSHPF